MAATYTPIASITLGAAVSSITFSSIPQTYTDLVLVAIGFDVPGNGYLNMQINGDTASNYSRTTLSGNGSSASTARTSNSTVLFPSFGNSATNIGQETIHFQNYSNTTTNKSMLFRGNQTGGAVTLQACLYRSTSAISSFTLSGVGGNIGSGSTFNLYGIQAGNA